MAANNEIDTISDLKKIGKIVHGKNILFYMDGCQERNIRSVNLNVSRIVGFDKVIEITIKEIGDGNESLRILVKNM